MKKNEDMTEGKENAPGGEETVEETAQITELPDEEIARLRAELAARTKEAEDNHNRFLRAYADLENYKKRAEKEKADCITFANENLITEVLGVIDNLERALSHAKEENLESLMKGLQLIVDQMNMVLKKFGLQEIKAVGEKFDPSLHHAISHEDTTEVEPDTVVKEFQKGFLLKGRLLRASIVAVAKRPETTVH